MKYQSGDVIKTLVKKETIPADTIGTIVFSFSMPNEAYEVEFADENGVPYSNLVYLPCEIKQAVQQ